MDALEQEFLDTYAIITFLDTQKNRGRGGSSTMDTMGPQHNDLIKVVYTLWQGAYFMKSTKLMSKPKSPHNSSEWFYCLIYDT